MSGYYFHYQNLTDDQLYDKLSKITKQYNFYTYMGNHDAAESLRDMSDAINTILYERMDIELFNKYHKPGVAIDPEPKKDDVKDETTLPKRRRRDLFG